MTTPFQFKFKEVGIDPDAPQPVKKVGKLRKNYLIKFQISILIMLIIFLKKKEFMVENYLEPGEEVS